MSTELVEPSGIITVEEQQELVQKLGATEGESHVGALCIMGSMPPGCSADLYADIYERVHGKNTLTLIDSVVGLDPLLKAIAESKTSGSTIIKVNASELCRLAQVSKISTEVGGIDPAELVDGVKSFLNKPYALQALTGFAITDGKHPAHCITIDKDKKELSIYKIPVPDLESAETLYPIGAGDTVAAGTLSAWRYLQDGTTGESSVSLGPKVESVLQQREQSANDNSSKATSNLSAALAFGLACGSASCLEEENSQFDVDVALKLLEGTGRPAFVSSYSIDV
jgi:fructose-1-phosphate kinase PfkB-like protein